MALLIALTPVCALAQPSDADPLANLRLPDRHPYIAVTPQGIAVARERAAKYLWAGEALKALTGEADIAIAKPLGKLPEKSDFRHWEVATRLMSVGLAHAFTGERKYAEWVRDGLIAYADIYPGLPMTNGRCKVFSQSPLCEAIWAESIAQAYDLIADSGVLSAEQRQHIERDLIRAYVACFKVDDYKADPRIQDLHYRCYNFQAWHLAAVGLAGLALRDPGLIRWAVDSPYGLRHLVSHDIRDDGLFWERSVGYHHFVISALLPFLEGAQHCGADLYHLTAPNDRKTVETCHYPTDTTDKPKSLHLMFEAPFYLGYPNLGYPALGDSDRGPLRANWTHLIGWARYHDPKLAWLLNRDIHLRPEFSDQGRVGLLHYYRYRYRYEDVRLNGKPIRWGIDEGTYQKAAGAITAVDGGSRQGDHYLLNDADLRDCTFEFTMTRLEDFGGDERAWLVYHVDARDPGTRKTVGLTSLCAEVGKPYRFRLEVKGAAVRLSRDGALLNVTPTACVRSPDWHWLTNDLPETQPTGPAPFSRDGTFANSGTFRNGCSLFPATGVAVLRQAGADFDAQPNSTAAALSYGPYGGGHGHPDKLSLTVFAQGREWIPLFGSMPYETHWKAEWTAHTISHNTVVVDGISQKPTRDVDQGWPVDTGDNRVVGKLTRFDPANKLASASCDSAYDGLTLGRTVRLRGALVIDQVTVTPQVAATTAARQVDYALHIDGAFAESTPALTPRSGALGTKCGYQWIEQKAGGQADGVASLTFTAEGKRLRLWVVPLDGTPTEIILGDGLTNDPALRMPMVILRRKGATVRYLTVIEPVDARDPLKDISVESAGVGKWPTLVLQTASGKQRVALQ